MMNRTGLEQKRNMAWLHVEVTWEAKQIAKIAALQSGMAFSSYIEQLLRRAKPIGRINLEEFVVNDDPGNTSSVTSSVPASEADTDAEQRA